MGERSVPLRYGKSYEFRVRLTDLTGGGPGPDAENEPPSGIALCRFRRFVPRFAECRKARGKRRWNPDSFYRTADARVPWQARYVEGQSRFLWRTFEEAVPLQKLFDSEGLDHV